METNVFTRTPEILIVDDHAAIRSGIRSLLQSRPQWHVCGEAVDGIDALAKVKSLKPDVVLMDVSMPRMDGLTAMRLVQREAPRTRIIIVTQDDTAPLSQQGVRADGYVLKLNLGRDLIRTIDRVLAAGRNGSHNGETPSRTKAETPRDAPVAELGSLRVQGVSRTDLLAAIVDSSDDAIVSKNLNGIITSWNNGAERIFGYTAEEMLGASILRIVPPDRHGEVRSIIARIRRGERVDHFETVRVRKDGSRVDCSVSVSPIKDLEGRVVGASSLSRDITEQKGTERNEALLATIVDSSDDAIVSKDLDGIVLSWNRGAERLFGYGAEEMIGHSITRIIPAERHAEENNILARIRRGQRLDHFETDRLRKDGSTVDVSVTISPLVDSRGRVVGASKVARDVTERKQVDKALIASEKNLRRLADDLEQTVHARTEELERRNAEIVEQSEQLRELSSRLQQGQDAERRRIARELHDSAGQLLAVLRLNLGQVRARIEPDEATTQAIEQSEQLLEQLDSEIRTMSYLLHPPLLDESGLFGAIRWYARGLTERAGFDIDLDIPVDFGRLPPEMELALFRIVQECLTNIHRHSGSKRALIHLSLENGNVRMEVQDEGKGMSPDQLAGHRTGVGITGMRERVRQFGGTMGIESSDHGTRVSVVLPVPKNFPSAP